LYNNINKLKNQKNSMVISVKNITQKQGGNGGTNHDDYKDILDKFGGVTNITSIKPKQAIIRSGDSTTLPIESLQFVYNVVTEDGTPHDYTGNNCGGSGGVAKSISFADDEQITGINGSYGVGINYLHFQTSKGSYDFGKNSPADTLFTLPAGRVFFCNSGSSLDSLGTYEIEEVPSKTVTLSASAEISTMTDVVTSTLTVDSSRDLAIGLGASGFGLAACLAIGAFVYVFKLK